MGFGSERLRSLLVYLVVHRHAAQERRHLALLLWPDSPEGQARNNLRQLLHNLRYALPESERFLDIGVRDARWRPDAPAEIDMVRFEQAAERAEASPARDTLVAAAKLYGGDLLPGCYDHWIVDERERLRARYARVLERLMTLAEDSGDDIEGIGYAQELLRVEPLHEEAYRSLMRLYAEAGDRARALRVYHQCASVLADELSVEPSLETQRLHRALLDSPDLPSGDRGPASAGAAAPLVGRAVEWQRLHGAWTNAAQARTRLVLVTGEAGIGKSRLVDELSSWCAHRGVLTAKARAYAAEGRLPYAPIVDLVRSKATQPHLTKLDAVHTRELARLLPELGPREELHPGLLTEAEQRRQLFEALVQALLAAGTSTLLVLDDLQWADGETIAFLHYLARVETPAHFMVAATVRDDEVGADHPLAAVLASLRRIGAVDEIRLGPLERQDVRSIAQAVAGREIGESVVERLFQESEGNPFFLTEMIRAGGGSSAAGLPPGVQAVIAQRLGHLSDNARGLAGVAAVLGREFTFEELLRTSKMPEDAVVEAIDELWERRLVKEQGTDAYDFTHDKIREVAYSRIAPARRHRIHRDAARAIEAVHQPDLDRVAARVAAHYDRGGLPAQAVASYERAIAAARRVFADAEVVALARRALALVDQLPQSPERDGRELSLLMSLGVALYARKGIAESRAVYERARRLCLRRRGQVDPPILRIMGNLAITRRRFPDAYARGVELLQHWEHHEDPIAKVEGYFLIGAAEVWRGEVASGRRNLQQAVASYHRDRASDHIENFAQDAGAICLSRVGFASWYLGELDRAFTLSDQALGQATELAHPYTTGVVLSMDAWLSVEAGDIARLRGRLDDMEALALPNAFVEGMMRASQGWLHIHDGDLPAGITRLRQALDGAVTAGEGVAESFIRPLLARACAIAGDAQAGLRILEHGRSTFIHEMPFHAAEFQRLRGEFLAACEGDQAEVVAAFRRASAIAQDQKMMPLELRARTSLVRWLQETGADEAATSERELQDLLGRFAEGLQCRDLVEARAVLGQPA